MSNNTQTANRKKKKKLVSNTGGWGGGVAVLLRIIRGGVLSGSPNPDPFLDQNMSHQNMSHPCRPDL